MVLACSRALCQWQWTIEKVGGRQAGPGRERENDGRACKHCLRTSFRYTSSWYTLWLVTFDSLYQHLVCLSEAKWPLTWQVWYTCMISRSQNLLKRSEWSKECVWTIWPVDRFREKFAICYLHVASQSFHTSVICNVLICLGLFPLQGMFKVLLNNIRSWGEKFEIFCKHLAYLHYIIFIVYCCKYTNIIFIFVGFILFSGVKWKPEISQCSQATSDACERPMHPRDFRLMFLASVWSSFCLELDVLVCNSFVQSGTTWFKCGCLRASLLTILLVVFVVVLIWLCFYRTMVSILHMGLIICR